MDTNKVKKLAKDLAKDFPRSQCETLAGNVIAAAPSTSAGQHWLELQASTTSIVHGITFSLVLPKSQHLSRRVQKLCTAGNSGEEVAKQRPRGEIIKWNNEWRYKRLSAMPDPIQEFMEEYAPEFVPPEL